MVVIKHPSIPHGGQVQTAQLEQGKRMEARKIEIPWGQEETKGQHQQRRKKGPTGTLKRAQF